MATEQSEHLRQTSTLYIILIKTSIHTEQAAVILDSTALIITKRGQRQEAQSEKTMKEPKKGKP